MDQQQQQQQQQQQPHPTTITTAQTRRQSPSLTRVAPDMLKSHQAKLLFELVAGFENTGTNRLQLSDGTCTG
jgi:hypothetical protein